MIHSQFLRMKKLTGRAIILVAAKHNHRELLAELRSCKDHHIDPVRTHNNVVLRGPATAIAVERLADSLMTRAGVTRLRKDAVRALEIIFSLPSSFRADAHTFFSDAVEWAEKYFNVPLISAIVHNDEAAPHCHVLLLPLVNGRMIGSELMGNRSKLQAIQADFQRQIGACYGLVRPPTMKRLSSTVKRQTAEQILQVLKSNPERIEAPGVHEALLAAIGLRLEPLLLALELSYPAPKPKKKTFVELMTMPVKSEKPIGFEMKNPIGFSALKESESPQTLSCVGFGASALPISPSDRQQIDPTETYRQETESDTQPKNLHAQFADAA